LLEWPSILTDLDADATAVDSFMVRAAQGLQIAEPELRYVALMRFDVVHDFGDGDDTALSPAELA
jgi:hypothetical protein